MAIEKIKRVEVETSVGKRYAYFRYLPLDPDMKVSCETICSYGGRRCSIIKDPRNPNDKYARLKDFCAYADDVLNRDAEEAGKPGVQYFPVEMTLEDNFWDVPEMNVFEVIIEKDCFVRVEELIDNLCVGECPAYRPDHGDCKSSVSLCMLHKIFKNKNYSPEKVKCKETEKVEITEEAEKENT